MKKLLPFFAILFVLYSCNKDGSILSDKDKLSAETRTDANTMGGLVNEKGFLPHGKGSNTGVTCFYQIEQGQQDFILNFADYSNSKSELVALQTTKIDVTGAAGIYELDYTNSLH